MKRLMIFTSIWSIFAAGASVFSSGPGDPPPPSEWTIEDPNFDEATYESAVACNGAASEKNAEFQLQIAKQATPLVIANSASGTSNSSSFTWNLTVQEPSGGWTSNNVAVPADVRLRVGGVTVDTQAILVK